MSLDVQALHPRPRVTADERARLKEIAASVGRAARVLVEQGRASLAKADLEARGMLAVWRKLPQYDPARADFGRWAFYQALHAMMDASREQRRETWFEAAVRRGAHGYVAQDERPAEQDFHDDTPETDRARLRARTRAIAAAAWLQPVVEQAEAGAPAEQAMAASEEVRIVHDELGRLSDEGRTYLRLRFWDDAEVAEVAARMQIPERSLRRNWARTRDLLGARLRARGIFGVPEGFGEAADALAMDGPGRPREGREEEGGAAAREAGGERDGEDDEAGR